MSLVVIRFLLRYVNNDSCSLLVAFCERRYDVGWKVILDSLKKGGIREDSRVIVVNVPTDDNEDVTHVIDPGKTTSIIAPPSITT
ncbi:hypothetical protein Tco_0696764 [Tanacetum coccineum]